ncbi:DUF6809 family protein [Faecalispora jeddahensis]|uniref:DUF6809 family protein n=1 Tax=Faecalispora jeddahensis TaxID=1414721 RepID=UPI00145ABCAC|nr:DUF6809 family protein [Faecalispora jeddahensis]
MQNILNELYNQYFQATPQPQLQKEIEKCHQALIRSLEKPERKLVLRIIDDKDLIAGTLTRESFNCGFRLAWRLLTELNIYNNGHLVEEQLNSDDRFFMKNSDIRHDEIK